MTQYAHRIWGQEEGLFQPTIYSILQTDDGLLWLGTQDSLIHFDGTQFHEFEDGHSVLHGSLIRGLAKDRQGNLWAASLGSGVARISPQGALTHYSTQNGLPSDSVFGIAAARDGTIWATTPEGLVHIHKGKLDVLTTRDGLPSKRVRAVCQAANGTIWVAGLDAGLSHQSGSRFAAFPLEGALADESITALDCAADGSLWAGSSIGLTHILGQKASQYTAQNGLPDNDVLSLTESPGGTLWIGTNDGVTRLRNGQFSVYRTRDGLSHSQVLALFSDREGNLWTGTKNGLDQFADGKVTPYTTNEGLLSNEVGPVLEDKSGQLWIGTLGHGLNVFDGEDFRALTTKEGLISDTVLSLASEPSGDLWVGEKGGINLVRKSAVVASFGVKEGLQGSEVRSLYVDSQNTLWAGTEAGLQHLVGSRFAQISADGMSRNSVLALSGGPRVKIFASLSESGLYSLHDNHALLYPLGSTRPVDSFLLVPEKRTIWMGTLGSGLLRWKDGVVSHVYVRDGLYDNRIYSILRDDAANFWLASSKGIFRISEQELEDFAAGKRKTITSLPFTTGQLRFECRAGVQPAACRTKDGRLWFSTTSGLVVVDPAHLNSNRAVPPVKIVAILVDGKRRPRFEQLHLTPHNPNNLEIVYAGLSYISPEKVSFRYQLEGYDRGWIDAGTRRQAFYTNLPPGNFNFRVEARNADGVWSTEPASLRFMVEPKLYQRKWFFPALVLVLGLAVLAAFRLRIRRLKERFSLILAERNRIARELHDTLLQGLSGITMQMQAVWTKLPPHSPEKKLLGEIIQDAGRCSTEARQSLWGLRHNTDKAGMIFSDKLAQLARQAVKGCPIALSLQIDPVNLSASPDAEYQLLRLAREAIANTLKHAGALRLTVTLQSEPGCVVMEMADDGFGFTSSSGGESPGHYGLRGMRERAEEVGAEILIVSSKDEGTRVRVSLPLSKKAAPESNQQPVHAHHID